MHARNRDSVSIGEGGDTGELDRNRPQRIRLPLKRQFRADVVGDLNGKHGGSVRVERIVHQPLGAVPESNPGLSYLAMSNAKKSGMVGSLPRRSPGRPGSCVPHGSVHESMNRTESLLSGLPCNHVKKIRFPEKTPAASRLVE